MKAVSDEYTNFDNSSLPMMGGVEGSPSRTSDPNQSTFLTKLPEDQEERYKINEEKWKILLHPIDERIERIDDRFSE